MAYRIDGQNPLHALLVALAGQRDSYWFPGDAEFRHELLLRDILWIASLCIPSALELAKQAELRELAERRDVAKVPMNNAPASFLMNFGHKLLNCELPRSRILPRSLFLKAQIVAAASIGPFRNLKSARTL